MAEYRSIDDLQRMFHGTLSDRLGMRIAQVASERVVMTHPGVATVADLHAVTAILAESAGSAVAVLAARPADAVGVELSITHYPQPSVANDPDPQSAGPAARDPDPQSMGPATREIIATATLLAAADGLLTCAISISDAAGTPLAEARLQCMARTVRQVTAD